jgi:hypothetical protein
MWLKGIILSSFIFQIKLKIISTQGEHFRDNDSNNNS